MAVVMTNLSGRIEPFFDQLINHYQNVKSLMPTRQVWTRLVAAFKVSGIDRSKNLESQKS